VPHVPCWVFHERWNNVNANDVCGVPERINVRFVRHTLAVHGRYLRIRR